MKNIRSSVKLKKNQKKSSLKQFMQYSTVNAFRHAN